MLVRAYKGKAPTIGERVFIAETASVIGDVAIGHDSSIWYGTVIRADVQQIRIGARTNVQDNCTLHVTHDNPLLLEDQVTLGHGVIAHGCVVRRGSLIGMGSRLLDGVIVGDECIVAAGALVSEGTIIPPRSLVIGFPAKIRRALTPEDLDYLGRFHRNYLEYKEIYLGDPPGEFR